MNRALAAANALHQKTLMEALSRVQASVESWLELRGGSAKPDAPADSRESDPASALSTVCAAFRLSAFERDLLLLCAGPDLDPRFADLVTATSADRGTRPTFALALAALPGAHWSALAPSAPLRRWRLIELGAGDSLTTKQLHIDERVLHYLVGIGSDDERATSLLQTLPVPRSLTETQRGVAAQVGHTIATAHGIPPLILLCGAADADQLSIAARATADLGLELHRLRVAEIPGASSDREMLARLIERESVLARLAVFVDLTDSEPAERVRACALLDVLQCPTIAATRDPLEGIVRDTVRFDVARPPVVEQQELWRTALGPLAAQLNGDLDAIARQFQLSAHGIQDAAQRLVAANRSPREPNVVRAALWAACREQARARLDTLAQRIDPMARWDDLVLPDSPARTLRDIAAHVRQRFRVYERWGFAAKSARGLGMTALFVGASGTGKTMAAEVLANDLELDLFRIDLSAVVSKYIGETEKNLRRVFDAAEAGGAILLFDEADALFGKRSEVRDSHDRYANIEVGYLLQRMEAYRGLAVLTTNAKNALDQAFLRRLRFVVHFPFPEKAERALMWQRVFPAATPTEDLVIDRLASLNVAGGNIRNIAMHAAFLAADVGEPVRMRHVAQAARSEYAKLDRPFNDSEIGGAT